MPGLVAQLGFNPDILHTFDKLEGHKYQPLVMYMFSLLPKRAQIPQPIKSAAVATTPETRSLARLFKACNHSPNLHHRGFRFRRGCARMARKAVAKRQMRFSRKL